MAKKSQRKYPRTVGQMVAGIALSVALGTAIKAVWRKAVGDLPDSRDPDTPMRQVLGWAAVSGLGAAVTDIVIARFQARQARANASSDLSPVVPTD